MTNQQLDEEAIFHVARQIPGHEARATYLDQVCAGDQALRERVEALLDAHEQESKFLKSSPDAAPTADHKPITEAPGQQIGRFKLLQQIGEGGFGVVYMAEQVRPVRRKVALKIIKPGMDTHAVVARFEAERQALAMMDHPNIARVLDGGATDSGRPYFVMELVRGVPITEYCDENNLPTNERLELFTIVCQAVQHAHQKGIIHRDLKPSNILVTLADGEPVVKVIDFGVSKALNQQLTEKTLFTAYGQMIGTPQYMSPEQAEMSCLDVDTRSDIYSLGVVLYELLTGTTPLEGERLRTAGFAEMQRIIQEVEPPKPSVRLSTSGDKLTIAAKHRSVPPDRLHRIVKGDLDWIVMKALEKERARRYATASSLAEDVVRFLDDETVTARPPSAGYRFAKFASRNRAAVVVAVTVLSVLVVGMAATLWQSRLKEDARGEAVDARLDAENAYEQLKATVVKLEESLFDQGVAYALSGDFDSARDAIDALERVQSESLTRHLQAVLWLEEGRAGEAVALLEPEVKRNPESVALRALLTLAYDSEGDIDKWYQSHRILKDMEPETTEDLMFAAIAYILDPEKAVRFASKAFKQRKSPSILLTHGRSKADWAMQAGKPELVDAAIRDVNTACDLLGNSGRAPAVRLGAHILAANTLHTAGHNEWQPYLEQAADSVDALLEEETLSAWDRLYLAEYYHLLGDLSRAWSFFDSAPESVWTDYDICYYLALATELGKDYEPSVLNRLQQEPLGPFSISGHAFVQVLKGNSTEARLEADRIIETYTTANSLTLALDVYQLAGPRGNSEKIAAGRLVELASRDVANEERWMVDNLIPFHAGRMNADQLVERGEESQYPNKYLGYAYWNVALDCLANNDLDGAKQNFQKCADTRGFYFHFCWWSRAFVAHLDRVDAWPPGGDVVAAKR